MAEPDVSQQAGVREQAEDSEPPDEAGRRWRRPGGRRRTELIAAAQARWVAALTDLGGRNTLLYYNDRRAGTLDLAAADPAALDKFLRTGSARLTRLFHDVDAPPTRSAGSRSSTGRPANCWRSAASGPAIWRPGWPAGTSCS